MRRSLVSFAAMAGFALLAACGGGGGGSTPGVPPGNPGPGPTATGAPSGAPSPTARPSGAPTTSPTITPVTPAPIPTPTPTPLPTATPTPNRTLVYSVGAGEINGNDTVFSGSPNAAEPHDGDYPEGGHGPVNSAVTGPQGHQVPCLSQMPSNYHVHAFLGFYNNGSAVALSDGIGMAEPEADGTINANNTTIPNWTNYATQCFYEMHTHDASGVIHMEATAPNCGEYVNNNPAAPCNMSLFTLGDFLTEWGVKITPMGVFSNGTPILNGPVQIWTSGQFARGGPTNYPEVGSNQYTLYTDDPNAIALYSHEVIWVLVGGGNLTGSSLPNVAFYEEW